MDVVDELVVVGGWVVVGDEMVVADPGMDVVEVVTGKVVAGVAPLGGGPEMYDSSRPTANPWLARICRSLTRSG